VRQNNVRVLYIRSHLAEEPQVTVQVELTFNVVDVEQYLSNNNTGVEQHNWTEKHLHLVAAQEFHKSLSSSTYKTSKNTTA